MSSGLSIDSAVTQPHAKKQHKNLITCLKSEPFSNEKDSFREKMPLCLVNGYPIVHLSALLLERLCRSKVTPPVTDISGF